MEKESCVSSKKVSIYFQLNLVGDASFNVRPNSLSVSPFSFWVRKMGSMEAAEKKATDMLEVVGKMVDIFED